LWRQCEKKQSRWRWLLLREHQEPPVSVLDPIEDPAPKKLGVCCSGGGMRSASFNLGALQEVQKADRLQEVRYLAAVSGGSYIAAAFAMVAKTRDAEGTRDTPGDESDAKLVKPENPPFAPGTPEEQYLRNRASYLAPTGADKAYLVWRVLLGLLINLLLIGTVVTLVAAVLAPYYRNQHSGLMRPPPPDVLVGASPNGWVWGLGLSLCAIGLVIGAFSILMRPRMGFRGDVQRALEVWSLPMFVVGLAIFSLEVLVPTLIDVLREDDDLEQVQATNTVTAGLSASVAAIVGAIIVQLRAQVADPVKAIKDANGVVKKLPPQIRLVVVYAATLVLGPLLIFAMLVTAIMIQVEDTRWQVRLFVPVGAALILFLFMRFADLTSWSLHPFYRRRLCTAFALRRIKHDGDPDAGHAEARKENALVPLSATRVRPESPPFPTEHWPTLLVCAAANVSDPGASPPGRGVTSFTFAPDEMGGPLVGGVETRVFENALTESRQRAFTLPAVVAMSGAAVSPSMGKVTRASVRFLMGMANVRLGVWLPNPRRMESFVRVRTTLRQDYTKGVWQTTRAFLRPTSRFDPKDRAKAFNAALANGNSKNFAMPRPTPRYLLKELLGWNSINDKFLYVTDGGHYENLGLVELLRRGCTEIYCFDASGGEQFGALGDAIALARSELAVEICFPKGALEKVKEDKETGFAEERCAVGTIEYSRPFKMTGRIVYAPTTLTKELPWDVLAFKEHDKAFPHHSTLDQLFTDQKFEAYRVLGCEAGKSAIKALDDAPAPAGTAVTQAAMPVVENGNGNGHDEGWRGVVDGFADWWTHHRRRGAGPPTATP
jgi:hypothetical protein